MDVPTQFDIVKNPNRSNNGLSWYMDFFSTNRHLHYKIFNYTFPKKNKTESAPPQQQQQQQVPQVIQQPAAAVQQPAPTPMKVDIPTKTADMSLSEDDLMKLKKINFKKKVTGK